MGSTYVFYLIIAFVLGAIVTYFWQKSRTTDNTVYEEAIQNMHNLAAKLAAKEENIHHLSQLHESLQTQLSEQQNINSYQEKEIIKLQAATGYTEQILASEKMTNQRQQNEINTLLSNEKLIREELLHLKTLNEQMAEKHQLLKEDFDIQRSKSIETFENLANKIMEEKSQKFSELNKINIEGLLNPLKENLTEFKKKVEDTYDKESKERFTLESKIKELVELNQKISQDANNLTNALKGQAKTQGNWGEMILENILEHSGLVKNREYFVQESYIDHTGQRKQPDITIKYPNDRYIIIDSKVSLTAYERMANSDTPEEQEKHLLEHLKSIRQHIDSLSAKEYEKIEKSLDFVMLFVPIEPAYMTAIHYDQDLWNYAYKKRILLISPTNLIAALKLVADIWKREYQNKNAIDIAKRGELLYEKFVGFVQDMDEIDKYLGKTKDKYDEAMQKLSKGSGNLIGQAEKLKRLGLNPSKNIDEKFIQDVDSLHE